MTKGDQRKIRVCLKCRSYMIINETYQNKQKLEAFESKHRGHTIITTDYSEIDNLECGKVVCEDNDVRKPMHYSK